ncbi:MAG: alpha-galactosidase [Alistipes sp.]|nr:alpha-galactosidase [Alistipes sp.]
MKRIVLFFAILATAHLAYAKEYSVSTPNTMLVVSVNADNELRFRYYGSRCDLADVRDSGRFMQQVDAYPAYGNACHKPIASLVKQNDGDNSMNLLVDSVSESEKDGISTLSVLLYDQAHPQTKVRVNYKAYSDCDIMKFNVDYINEGKKPLVLQKYLSAVLPVQSDNCVLLHLEGATKNEFGERTERLNEGIKVISSMEVSRTSLHATAAFMLGLDGRLEETNCPVIAGTLIWGGNYTMEFYNTLHGKAPTTIMAGINPVASDYTLAPKQTFSTPEMVFTYTTNGKGEASRTIHRWARKYQILDGKMEREVLLNSWEGVHFDTTEDNLNGLTKDIAALGGEMFVVDDGWFGVKYPRNNATSSLGDWQVNPVKLPHGIRPLIDNAHNNGIKFGIWIEPEMVNAKSELYEKHPDWVLRHEAFDPTYGRGGNQLLLDLTNPKVQDFVFGVVDDLLTQYPDIEYIKWDHNMSMTNAQSLYLPKALQSNLPIEYTLSLRKILQRIRAKYPKVIIQLCASGGARLNYEYFPYFQEMWTSDQTDAYHRVLIQWGALNFFPSNILAAHVGSYHSKYTQRVSPIKFRFDVASMCRLGMELVPASMSEGERAYAKRAIAAYKEIRPVVQQGDLYRLVSPYEGDKDRASMMYVSEGADKAVLFAYRFVIRHDLKADIIRLQGLDPNARYAIREVAPEREDKPVVLHGKVLSGKYLMEEGIVIPELYKTFSRNREVNDIRQSNDYRSVILELTKVK